MDPEKHNNPPTISNNVSEARELQELTQIALGTTEILDSPQLAITLKNQNESRLLCLPGELRNKIYSYAIMSGNRIRLVCFCRDNSSSRDPEACARFRQEFFGLSKVCRQIYEEVRLMMYAENSFEFFSFPLVDDFARRTGVAQRNAIKRIVFEHHTFSLGMVGEMNEILWRKLEAFGGLESVILIDPAFYTDFVPALDVAARLRKITGNEALKVYCGCLNWNGYNSDKVKVRDKPIYVDMEEGFLNIVARDAFPDLKPGKILESASKASPRELSGLTLHLRRSYKRDKPMDEDQPAARIAWNLKELGL
ncbi:hypothetical protein CC78DRAFT_539236 [Lojkania enalia]|uniref:DUF7730 domain-containing protein n=1 Tax=Lojkania enalia TaxID=147567 RepID=A0A9P4NCM9_9PLEO|nr:hypothetical protein CC78DRAFT_539236 [Didymosphaeria enalia]